MGKALKVWLAGMIVFPICTDAFAGDLEPPGPPGSTMHTLDEIYNKQIETMNLVKSTAPVEKTGQTASYSPGDDGEQERGIEWPTPRFMDNGDGTITDNLTGLIWMKDANCEGKKDWDSALGFCNDLASGQCGINDGSTAGDWRLANRKELESLLDLSQFDPSLPAGHPFTSVELTTAYWSSTTFAKQDTSAWGVRLYNGGLDNGGIKTNSYYVLCVRGGKQ
jgi:hypothetical protein